MPGSKAPFTRVAPLGGQPAMRRSPVRHARALLLLAALGIAGVCGCGPGASASSGSARAGAESSAGEARAGSSDAASELGGTGNSAGLQLAVATGKPRSGLSRAFARTGLEPHFQFSRCGDEGLPKPHADMLLRLMAFAQVGPARTLMIGDTTHDLALAENAGVSALGVAYGAHSRAELTQKNALAIVENVTELTAWLGEHG